MYQAFFPGDHYVDYLILDIDLDSGQIINWQAPTAESVENMLNESDD